MNKKICAVGTEQKPPATGTQKPERAGAVDFAQNFLDKAVKTREYEDTAFDSPARFDFVRRKYESILSFASNPKRVVCIGVGGWEELFVLSSFFGTDTVICGLDLSNKMAEWAKGNLAKHGIGSEIILGSAAKMPFADSSVDVFVASAVFHEIYSYAYDGNAALRDVLGEISRKLSDEGILLLRDFFCADPRVHVELHLKTPLSRKFYDYFHTQYRVFSELKESVTGKMNGIRSGSDEDYPCPNGSDGITIPFRCAAEVLLHFKNFYEDYTNHAMIPFDPAWKEINETYLVPDPYCEDADKASEEESLAFLLRGLNDRVTADHEVVCGQSKVSARPEHAALMAEHFSLCDVNGPESKSYESILKATERKEFIFKKVARLRR